MRIVFFDGYCSLCNALVDWLMRVDRSQTLRFASLQGEVARKYLKNNDTLKSPDMDTIVYLRDERAYQRSHAVLMILSDLGGVWKFAQVFLVVPSPLRDLIYNLVAKNRYRIFGKRDTCRIPTPEEMKRLLP